MNILVKKPSAEEIAEAESWGIWSKEASSFPWRYSESETCYILEGRATVTSDTGEEVSFGVGDWVVFPRDLSCTWTIHEDLRKHYKFG